MLPLAVRLDGWDEIARHVENLVCYVQIEDVIELEQLVRFASVAD